MNKSIANLHYITQDVAGADHAELAKRACSAGVEWVQLRVKNRSYNDWLEIALRTEMICRHHHAKFIVNDHVGIAKAVKADGVHLGKSDMEPREARKELGPDLIIGGTANTYSDIERLASQNVDYIGLGPFRFTETKENLSPVLGLEGYEKIIVECKRSGITIPIIAIGGIKVEDVKALMEKNVHGIAVSSAINLAENTSDIVKRFKNKIKFGLENRTHLR